MNHKEALFDQLRSLKTEKRNSKSKNLDSKGINAILRSINSEDAKIAAAVRKEIPSIARAVEIVAGTLLRKGRLIYIGAGTSGRLGILDAAECPPTFGTDPSSVRGIIAGGKKAVFRSQEGAEDRKESAIREIGRMKISERDVVCGIAASLRTPFVVAGIIEAKRRGAKTIYITTNPRSVLRKKEFKNLSRNIDVAICPDVGPEIIMGSTRMKSGTAQKLVLNMITTTAMIRLGKVYGNMMVDLKMNSRKLEERAKRVVMIVTKADYKTTASVLRKADGHVKTAIVMIKGKVSAVEARIRLEKAGGFVRPAIEGNLK